MFFQSYLYNRTQSCNINEEMSSYKPIPYCVHNTRLNTGSTTVHNLCSCQFCHNHPSSTHPWGFAPKICPHPGAFLHPSFCPGRRRFVGVAPKGQAFVYKQFLPLLNFHYNGKNWQLTTLSGLFVALKFYML